MSSSPGSGRGTRWPWSVDREILTRSYEHVADDRWRRTGEVFAQPAVPGELVVSLEGRTLRARATG